MGCGASKHVQLSDMNDSAHDDMLAFFRPHLFCPSAPDKPAAPRMDSVVNDFMMCPSARGELSSQLHAQLHLALPTDASDAVAQLRCLDKLLTTDEYARHPVTLLPALDTCAEEQLTELLGGISYKLVNKAFSGHESGHSRIVVGPRGSGKSMALRRFALSVSVLFPKLRVVYLDGRNVADNLREYGGSILQLLSEVLGLAGVACPSPPATSSASPLSTAATPASMPAFPRGLSSVTSFADSLLQRDEFLMLLVDEMERLYEGADASAVEALLVELEKLATNGSGRAVLIGCSSTSVLYPLVQGGGRLPATLKSHFPVLARPSVPDMNGSKLALELLLGYPPTLILPARMFCQRGASDAVVNCLAFTCGTLARRLYDVKTVPTKSPVEELHSLTGQMPKYTPYVCQELPLMGPLLAGLFDTLLLINAPLLLTLAKPDAVGGKWDVDTAAVSQGAWAAKFKPIEQAMVSAVLRAVNVSAPAGVDHSGVDNWMLDFLQFDAALIVRDAAGSVFPCSMSSLLMHMQYLQRCQHTGSDAVAAWKRFMHSLPAMLAKNAVDPSNYKALAQLLPTLLKQLK